MATVYVARDLRHDRRVAVKVLRPELGVILGGERFLSEIAVTAKLQHPHLLPLFDSGNADGLLYYVMPFVDGETLRQRLDRERQLPVEDAIRIARGIASALEYAHRQGVIHRDLKPENVLIHDGEALVADFGVALAVSHAAADRITQSRMVVGTPQYMSPEQAAGDRLIDARSDIYSLGAALYEMLAGEPPHTGPSAQSVLAKIASEPPRPVSSLRRTVPFHIDVALERALAKLPADRFSSAREFAEALAPTSAAAARLAATSGWRRFSARDRVYVIVGALLIAAIGASASYLATSGRVDALPREEMRLRRKPRENRARIIDRSRAARYFTRRTISPVFRGPAKPIADRSLVAGPPIAGLDGRSGDRRGRKLWAVFA